MPKKYKRMIWGKRGKNKEDIETKSRTQIIQVRRHKAKGRLICKMHLFT